MSLYHTETVSCPSCGEANRVDMFYSVNSDRRPDLRQAVLDRNFQQQTCSKCHSTFRVDPDLNYLDAQRGQWIAAHPFDRLGLWETVLADDVASFDKSYGPAASEGARDFGRSLAVRVVFGWPAFREKLVAQDAALDDRDLELLKMAILRRLPKAPLSQTVELRLVDVVDGKLVLCWVDAVSDEVVETLLVPMRAYDDIATDTESWGVLRETIGSQPFVDMQRLMI